MTLQNRETTDSDGAAVAGAAAAATSDAAQPTRRNGKLKKSGEEGYQLARDADDAARRDHAPRKAEEIVNRARVQSAGPKSEAEANRRATEVAAEMEKLTWSVGGYKMAELVFRKYLARPSIRTIQTYLDALRDDSESFASKDEQAKAEIILNLRTLVEKFASDGATLADRQCVNGCIACLVRSAKSTNAKRTGRAYQRVLGITYRLFKKCQDMRAEVIDKNLHWEHRKKAPYRNRISDEYLAKIGDLLHTDEFSYVDNDHKGTARIYSGTTATGAIIYTDHAYRVQKYSRTRILELLTGFEVRNGAVSERKIGDAHPVWLELIEVYGKVRGSFALLRRAWCKCFTKPQASICVCTLCYQLRDNIKTYKSLVTGWHARYRSDHDGADCDCSGGRCHPVAVDVYTGIQRDSDLSLYRRAFHSDDALLACTQCPPPDRGPLALPVLDPITQHATGEMKPLRIPPRACSELTCERCGVNRTFEASGLPKCTVTGPDGDTSLYACRLEASTTERMTWNVFATVNRRRGIDAVEDNVSDRVFDMMGGQDPDYQPGSSKSGTTIEFIPRNGTRFQFFTEMFALADKVKAHNYLRNVHRRVQLLTNRDYTLGVAENTAAASAHGTILVSTDWAAVASTSRQADATCSTPETHNTAVYYVRSNPTMATAGNVAAAHRQFLPSVKRAGLERRKLEAQLAVVRASVARLEREALTLRRIMDCSELPRIEAAASPDEWTSLWGLHQHDAFLKRGRISIGSLDGGCHDDDDLREAVGQTEDAVIDRWDKCTADLERGRRDEWTRVAKLAALVTRERSARWLTTTNLCVYVYTVEAGCAAIHNTAMLEITALLNTGMLRAGSKAEAFVNGKRVVNSNKSGPPLPANLSDADGPVDLGTGQVRRWVVNHDGCARQYEGLRNYVGLQQFSARTAVIFRDPESETGGAVDVADFRGPPQHGKGIHDGLGPLPAAAVRRRESVVASADAAGAACEGVQGVGTGLQNFVRGAAAALMQPRHASDKAARGFNADANALNVYVHIFLPDVAIDHAAVNAEVGYEGSSTDFFRRPVFGGSGGNLEATRLIVRHMPCACRVCIVANGTARSVADFTACEMRGELPLPRLVRLRTKALDKSAAEVYTIRLQTFCEQNLKTKGAKVVVRRKGDSDDGEPYWIAFVRVPFWVAQQKETHEGETYSRNMRLVGITWAGLKSQLPGKPLVYEKLDWHAVISANYVAPKGTAILRGKNRMGNLGFEYNRRTKNWDLSTDVHERIVQFGDVFDPD